MDKVNLVIDNIRIKAEPGMTVLRAATEAGIYIPTLCSHPILASSFGVCRLCVVEVAGQGFPSSCITTVEEGMRVHINTPLIRQIRRHMFKAVLSPLPSPRLRTAELQRLADYIGVKENELPPYVPKNLPVSEDEPLFLRDHNLCILCGRCVNVCRQVRKIGVLDLIIRDGKSMVGPAPALTLKEAGCRFCGACVEICPTGALMDKDGRHPSREARIIPCRHTCPAGIDVPRYVHLVAQRRFGEAAAVVQEKVPFPWVLGHVCLHPCEDNCRRGELNEPIAIAALKRAAAERDRRVRTRPKLPKSTGKRVAIVGSGPAGLTAAFYLAKQGHAATVFEALPEPGGMMRVGIPEYRLPREVLDAEIDEIRQAGVEIRTNARVKSLAALFGKGYDAIFLALGAHQGVKLGVEGEDLPGVLECVDLLRQVNLGEKVKLAKKVAVVGGGNAAIDAARVALRLGAKEVTIIYRRSRAEIPASPEEVDRALEEGVKILYLAAPSRITEANGLLSMECIRMKLGKPDSSGRRRPLPIAGSEFAMEFGNVIAAIGQTPEIPGKFGVQTGNGNTIDVALNTLATSRDGVFAGGDVVLGPASVIEAIAAGRKAAISIDRYLGGSGDIEEKLAELEEPDLCLERSSGFADLPRARILCLPVESRQLRPFDEVEFGLDEEAAVQEANRCLRCDLRLQIMPVIPPSKR